MDGESPDKQPIQHVVNLTVITVLAKVGCLTFTITLAAIIGGLWLDNYLGTRPWITILLVLLSAPFVSWAIYKITIADTAHLRSSSTPDTENKEEHPSERN
jgi:hypothetical protein